MRGCAVKLLLDPGGTLLQCWSASSLRFSSAGFIPPSSAVPQSIFRGGMSESFTALLSSINQHPWLKMFGFVTVLQCSGGLGLN